MSTQHHIAQLDDLLLINPEKIKDCSSYYKYINSNKGNMNHVVSNNHDITCHCHNFAIIAYWIGVCWVLITWHALDAYHSTSEPLQLIGPKTSD